jgi:hypothetical protein
MQTLTGTVNSEELRTKTEEIQTKSDTGRQLKKEVK